LETGTPMSEQRTHTPARRILIVDDEASIA